VHERFGSFPRIVDAGEMSEHCANSSRANSNRGKKGKLGAKARRLASIRAILHRTPGNFENLRRQILKFTKFSEESKGPFFPFQGKAAAFFPASRLLYQSFAREIIPIECQGISSIVSPRRFPQTFRRSWIVDGRLKVYRALP